LRKSRVSPPIDVAAWGPEHALLTSGVSNKHRDMLNLLDGSWWGLHKMATNRTSKLKFLSGTAILKQQISVAALKWNMICCHVT